ncbi:MAG: hypothetical protein EOO05_11365 [Chitinophagaceae bacterium]|nr:MAG: hypothetical protein EOO05_11365 [Chitinophagaceae bacterium]
MASIIKTFITATFLVSLNMAFAQTKPAADILGVPLTLSLGSLKYKLSWSSHPNANYYKEEFLPAGETSAKFKNMILLDAVTSSSDLDATVDGKLAELAELQKTNPAIFFHEATAPAGERIIDFTITAYGADGKTLAIAERNVYRYRLFTDKAGNKGMLLFAVAQRAYGNAIPAFLAKLKTTRETLVRLVREFSIPAFTRL